MKSLRMLSRTSNEALTTQKSPITDIKIRLAENPGQFGTLFNYEIDIAPYERSNLILHLPLKEVNTKRILILLPISS